jgi:hypothetical protein
VRVCWGVLVAERSTTERYNRTLLHLAGLQGIAPQDQATLADWWLRSRKQVPKAARKEFDSAVLLTSWNLWKERNRRSFEDTAGAPPPHRRRSTQLDSRWFYQLVARGRNYASLASAGFRYIGCSIKSVFTLSLITSRHEMMSGMYLFF